MFVCSAQCSVGSIAVRFVYSSRVFCVVCRIAAKFTAKCLICESWYKFRGGGIGLIRRQCDFNSIDPKKKFCAGSYFAFRFCVIVARRATMSPTLATDCCFTLRGKQWKMCESKSKLIARRFCFEKNNFTFGFYYHFVWVSTCQRGRHSRMLRLLNWIRFSLSHKFNFGAKIPIFRQFFKR